MKKIKHLKCVKCGKEYREEEQDYNCPDCGYLGILDIVYDYNLIKETKESLKNNPDYSIARYFNLLPLEKIELLPPLRVGWSPLYKSQRINSLFNTPNLYLKDDSQNPTASTKDRASFVGVANARERGEKTITCASTGNAACSLAGMAAATGIKIYIFVPENAPPAKITQLLIYGANIFLVKGSYDEAWELCMEASYKYKWYNRNCAINPYLVEGKKTLAFEIAEQMNWEAPDIVFVATGDGCILSSLYKGFYDLKSLNFISKIPRLISVQAEGCQPLKKAFDEGKGEVDFVIPKTLADSISVGRPRNQLKALKAVRATNGFFVAVSDQEILSAIKTLANLTGIFVEPAAAASWAGFKKAMMEKQIDPQLKIVINLTGSGLKDIQAANKAVGKGNLFKIKPKLRNVAEALKL